MPLLLKDTAYFAIISKRAFNESSVVKLARVLPWYLIASIFISGLNLLRNYFFASGKISYIARLGILIPICFSILAYNLKEI